MNNLQFPSARVQFLSDGHFPYPSEFIHQGEAGAPVDLPYRVLHLEAGGQRILVDTGAGPSAPTTGQLLRQLSAAGIPPESIDTVFLTHAHPDHIGGLRGANGAPNFPNAQLVLARKEWEHWQSLSAGHRFGTGAVFGAPDVEEYAHAWLQNHLFPFAESVTLVEDFHTLAPGVHAFACPGHTPGHMAVEIAGEFLYLADLFVQPGQIANPHWTMPSDADPAAILRSRTEVLDRAAGQSLLLAMCHSPELGRVHHTGSSFCWTTGTPTRHR